MPDETRHLTALRRAIDRIDAQLLRLLNQRVRLARRIGALKRRLGNHWVDPQRERAIFARLRRRNRGPLTDAALRRIYARIFAQTRAVQRPRRRAR